MAVVRALSFSLAIAALSLCTAPARATGDPSAAKRALQWFDKVAAGERVRVLNPLGNVYARFGGYEGQVEILATLQKLDPARPDLEVDRRHVGGALEIEARYVRLPDAPPVATAAERGDESPDRIDLVLFVPLGASLEIETVDGSVEVKGTRADLDVKTQTGDVKISKVEGRVRALSERGAIHATLESGVTGEPQELRTETGEIEVYLWEDARQEVALATSGRIATDFSIVIEHRRFEEPGKHAGATVGDGGPRLTLYSKRGDLSLLRLPRHFQPDP